MVVVESGNDFRKESAKRVFRESRMQTARAIVSNGSAARVRRAWTSEADGAVRDTEVGIRFVRWIAGPGDITALAWIPATELYATKYIPNSSGSRYSVGANRASGVCWRELAFEWDDRGGVGKLDSGT